MKVAERGEHDFRRGRSLVRGSEHLGVIGVYRKGLLAGMFLAQAIMMALLQRETTGKGQWVHTSLLEAMIFMLDFQAARWLMKGDVPGQKQPFHISRPGDELFAFGGIWEHWMAPDGSELESAAILTTTPNAMMEPIHNRMPVIIEPKDFNNWLDHSRPDGKNIIDLMKPIRDAYLVARETEMPRPQRRKPEVAGKPDPQPVAKADDQLNLF